MNGRLRAKGSRMACLRGSPLDQRCNKSGSFAMFTAIRRASSPASRRSLGDWTAADLGSIAQLRHAFLFGAMSTAKDRAVFFNPVADDVRATMRACRCEGLNCTFKAVKGVGAAV